VEVKQIHCFRDRTTEGRGSTQDSSSFHRETRAKKIIYAAKCTKNIGRENCGLLSCRVAGTALQGVRRGKAISPFPKPKYVFLRGRSEKIGAIGTKAVRKGSAALTN